MSGRGAAVRCDGCGRTIESETLSEADLRDSLMHEHGWVCDPRGQDGPVDACDLEECRDRIAAMVTR